MIIGSFIGSAIMNVIDLVKAGSDFKAIIFEILINVAMSLVVYFVAELLMWIFRGFKGR